ncbi:zinc ribbon domain-containing protein [Ligilactobacillus acidipiscis]|nr:zinc ribbon domain-containing protein [Ligilactobacillus acidipiscis]GAW64023.1 hypothetical protein Lacidipiscis_01212 [Ligilactobacillus acidipiscis]GEN20601.1 prophage P1 protein 5, superinfection exclusion (cell surface N-anchored) [Ligilactobacillus acidipiscis]
MSKQHKYCPNCGNELFGTEKFCGKCGFDVSSITKQNNSEKSNNEQARPKVNEPNENIQKEEHQDTSSVLSKPIKEQKNKQEVDNTKIESRSADRREKRISKIVWTIGILIALIGVGGLGIYMHSQNSHAATSNKVKKTQIKKASNTNKKPKSKNNVYSVKVSEIKIGGRRQGTDWIIKGTTKAPDNSTMVAILPKKNTVDLSGDAYTSNIATNTTDGEGEGVAEVHGGEFQIEITPDSSAYYGKNGDKNAVKDNQDIKVKIVAISNFDSKNGSVYSPLPENVLSRVNKKGKITILTTNHKQGEYYRNWGDDLDDSSSDDSLDTSSSDDNSDTDADDNYADNNISDDEEDDSATNSGATDDSATNNSFSQSENERKTVINNAQEAIAAAKKDDPGKDWKFDGMAGDDYKVTAMAKAPENGKILPYQEYIHPDGTIEK